MTLNQMKASIPVVISILIAITAAIMLVVLGIAAYTLTHRPEPAQPPLHYSAMEYPAEKDAYAPGETLIYTPTLTVAQEGRVDVLRSFWNRTQRSAALLCDGSAAPIITTTRNLPAGEVGNVRGGRAVRVEVPRLPPGDYWLISSATGPSGGQSVYQVSFEVRQAC